MTTRILELLIFHAWWALWDCTRFARMAWCCQIDNVNDRACWRKCRKGQQAEDFQMQELLQKLCTRVLVHQLDTRWDPDLAFPIPGLVWTLLIPRSIESSPTWEGNQLRSYLARHLFCCGNLQWRRTRLHTSGNLGERRSEQGHIQRCWYMLVLIARAWKQPGTEGPSCSSTSVPPAWVRCTAWCYYWSRIIYNKWRWDRRTRQGNSMLAMLQARA